MGSHDSEKYENQWVNIIYQMFEMIKLARIHPYINAWNPLLFSLKIDHKMNAREIQKSGRVGTQVQRPLPS